MRNLLFLLLILPSLCYGQPGRKMHTGDYADSTGIDSFRIPVYFKQIMIPEITECSSNYGCKNSIGIENGVFKFNNGTTWVPITGGGAGLTAEDSLFIEAQSGAAGWTGADTEYVVGKFATIQTPSFVNGNEDTIFRMDALSNVYFTGAPSGTSNLQFSGFSGIAFLSPVTILGKTPMFVGDSVSLYASKFKVHSDSLTLALAIAGKQPAGSYLTSNLTDGKILVGNGTGVATAVTPSGDATMSNAGVITFSTVNATPGSVGSGSVIPTLTINNKGQVPVHGTVAVAIAGSQITTGTVPLARGGTNADLSATGGANQFVKQSTAGGALSVGRISLSDLPIKFVTHRNKPDSLYGASSNVETPLDTILIPANTMDSNSTLSIDMKLSSTGGGGNKTFRIYIGTSKTFSSASDTIVAAFQMTSSNMVATLHRSFTNEGSPKKNSAFPISAVSNATDAVVSNTPPKLTFIDYTVDNYIVVTGQHSNITDFSIIRAIIICIFP